MERCEKIIWLKNLINKFADEKGYSAVRYTNWEVIYAEDYTTAISEIVLISKYFWFVKWLVINDMIDLGLIKKWEDTICYSLIDLNQTLYTQDWIDIITMELSLHIDPIDYLLLIIKPDVYRTKSL